MLSAVQKRFFYEEGYIKIPGAVPQIMVEAARHAMNHSIGSAGKQGEVSHRIVWQRAEKCTRANGPV
jgi:hypothetical protein